MGRIWVPRVTAVALMLALPVFGFSYATLKFNGTGAATVQADDSNGDSHSNCHRGEDGTSNGGGNDKILFGDCGNIL